MHPEKRLQDMTLEELWELFPVRLTAHRDCWADWYREEEALLACLLPEAAAIHHIGSTAVPGIWAKPIVDVLVELPDRTALAGAAARLEASGYLIMSSAAGRVSLNKGYTPSGFAERVFHIHLRLAGDSDEVCFREYLQSDPEAAKAYEQLKLRLWKEYEHDRDGYTEAKGAFVQHYTELAKKMRSGTASGSRGGECAAGNRAGGGVDAP